MAVVSGSGGKISYSIYLAQGQVFTGKRLAYKRNCAQPSQVAKHEIIALDHTLIQHSDMRATSMG